MTIYRTTRGATRTTVRLTVSGIQTCRLRRKAGGGWYLREVIVAPWPWVDR